VTFGVFFTRCQVSLSSSISTSMYPGKNRRVTFRLVFGIHHDSDGTRIRPNRCVRLYCSIRCCKAFMALSSDPDSVWTAYHRIDIERAPPASAGSELSPP
jgi:hypothetical protein